MDQATLINIGLALVGLIAVILLFILKAINNLNSLLETMKLQPGMSAAAAPASVPTVAADGISEEEVAVISAVIAQLMPGKTIQSIRLHQK
ncbi:MAG TPA: hypothetical protein PLC07_01925 [Bacillota bacterium]|nr:hypothetical protein [Bacillota bacterium]HPT87673.1 hypothetical protein [Bacillota bacterium]